MENLIAIGAVIGLVNGVRLALDKNWNSFAMFVVSLVAGVGAGALHYFGVPSIEEGILVALSASGLYRVAQKVGASD